MAGYMLLINLPEKDESISSDQLFCTDKNTPPSCEQVAPRLTWTWSQHLLGGKD